MKKYFYTALILFLMQGIHCTQRPSSDIVESFKLTYNMPIVFVNNGKINLTNKIDSATIFSMDDYSMFKLNILGNNSVNDPNEFKVTDHSYFIFKKGSKIGWFYESPSAKFNELTVDSFMKHHSALSSDFYDRVTLTSNDSLVEKITKGSVVQEKYIPKVFIDDSYSDTTILSFKLHQKSAFSLSPRTDSIKQMFLYKGRSIFLAKNSTKDSLFLPYRELSYEVEKVMAPSTDILFFKKNIQKIKDLKIKKGKV